MALTRRQFIQRTGVFAAGSFLGPSLLRNPFLQRALADTIGDRYFVVLFLDGGNDGQNTIVPDGGVLRPWYEAARLPNPSSGGLRLPAGKPLLTHATLIDPNTSSPLGLHPALQGLMDLYTAGNVAIVQGCGYPDYNLSHDISARIWQTADPIGTNGFGTGWMGRYLGANYGASDIPGVCIRDSIAGELQTPSTSVLAIQRLDRFGFPYDDWYEDDIPLKRDAFYNLCLQSIGNPLGTVDYLGNGGRATLLSSESYPGLDHDYTDDPILNRAAFDAQYDALDTGTARGLREIAKIIYGVERGVSNVNARFFELRNGGYDTHSDQGADGDNDQLHTLHKEVGDAIKIFYGDCADMGVADKLCILVWSEFSRRIPQNDNGTDHGSQGPMFVIGGKVNGGVYGNHPHIDPVAIDEGGNTTYSQDPGNGFRSTDFRDVYGTILKHWLNMPVVDIQSSVLPVDPAPPGEENDYWTQQNFDLSKDGGVTTLFNP
jgi:uncharacterized protein (DUF1501 family)